MIFAMNLQREHEEAKERVRDIKERAKRLLQIAKKATGTADGENLSQEIRMVGVCVCAKKYAVRGSFFMCSNNGYFTSI